MCDYVRLGSNAVCFANIMNAVSQKSDQHQTKSMEALSEEVYGLLPDYIVLADGTQITFPVFTLIDGQQSSCKLMQCFQSLITNCFGGRERERLPQRSTLAVAVAGKRKREH